MPIGTFDEYVASHGKSVRRSQPESDEELLAACLLNAP
jgi:hypothetical protein